MEKTKLEPQSATIYEFHRRRIGGDDFEVAEFKADIADITPNERQPRTGPKLDERLKTQIHANGGVFEPLLVERDESETGKYRLIDGERRWRNCQELVKEGHLEFRKVPVILFKRRLEEKRRLQLWVVLHHQRREWAAGDKEHVAHQLYEYYGRPVAADILGMTLRELNKVIDTYNLARKFYQLEERDAVTWARELQGIAKKLIDAQVINAVVDKVHRNMITNAKELRELRKILPDPVAKANFMRPEGDIRGSLVQVRPVQSEENIVSILDTMIQSLSRYSWRSVNEEKDDPNLPGRIQQAIEMLQELDAMTRQSTPET